MSIKNLILLLVVLMNCAAYGQRITTIAGTASPGFSGDAGPASAAQMNGPCNITLDKHGNIFFVDYYNTVIRKITPDGIITTVAGNGEPNNYGNGGPAIYASLYYPNGVAISPSGEIFIADADNNQLRVVDTFGIITRYSGADQGYYGDDGPREDALFGHPEGISFDSRGNLYIADCWNHLVRKIDTLGVVTTVAGNGEGAGNPWGGFFTGDGGPATKARLNNPSGVCTDNAGNLYIADRGNNRVRRVDAAGTITTVAGGGTSLYGDGGQAKDAVLSSPADVTIDAYGNLYIPDQDNFCVWMVSTSGIISRVAGSYINGYSGDGGNAINAHLKRPAGVAVDPLGNIWISDFGNNCIRKVDTSHTLGLGRTVTTQNNIVVSPNPNSGFFTLAGSLNSPGDQQVSIEITNVLGQVVYSGSATSQNGKINVPIWLENIGGGFYLLQVHAPSATCVIRFVVAH